jgi:hypothetical protein
MVTMAEVLPAENFSQDEVSSNDDIASKNRKEFKDVKMWEIPPRYIEFEDMMPAMKHRAQAEGFTRINVAGEYPSIRFYVRVRLPESLLDRNHNLEILPKSTLTFGFNDRLDVRDGEYGDDNGYIAYSFLELLRHDAYHVMPILLSEFSDMALFGSSEYLSVPQLAEKFKMSYDPTSYESYMDVAFRFFTVMVSHIRANCDGCNCNHRDNGRKYNLNLDIATPSDPLHGCECAWISV